MAKLAGSRQMAVGSKANGRPTAAAGAELPTRDNPSTPTTNYQQLPTACCHLPAARGISLIEVLFAMGILSVGILSLVMLIPLGAYELSESAKMDQSSTLGRASFRDLEVRAFLRPKLWVDTQLGCLIDPTVPSGQRLVAYPYVPPIVYNMYAKPAALQPVSVGSPQAVGAVPDPSTALYPLPYNYPYTQGALSQPLALPINYPVPAAPTSPPTFYPPFAATDSPVLILDPLMVATTGARYLTGQPNGAAQIPQYPVPTAIYQWTDIQSFPYQPTYQAGAPLVPRISVMSWPLPLFSGGPPTAIAQQPIWPNTLPWITSNPWPGVSLFYQPRIMPLPLADRIFRSSDDLQYNAPDRDHDRPTALYANATAQQSQGSFSWFVMISPNSSETDQSSTSLADPLNDPTANLAMVSAMSGAKHFNVSVVICQNRSLDIPTALTANNPPGEWMVPAQVNGAGFGGGDVTLFANDANHGGWLMSLHAGQWLMLSGINLSAEVRLSGTNKMYWPKFKTVANWYRIVAVDDGSGLDTSLPYRNVTLNGPDWPVGIQLPPPVSFDQLSNPPPGVNYGPQYAQLMTDGTASIYTFATIVDGVVGVYQKSITLDGDSPFAPP